MKYVATTAAVATALMMSGTSALAGSVGPVAVVDSIVVEDDQPMGSGSGAWIIPLLAIGLIALAVSQNEDDAPSEPGPPIPGDN